MGEGKPSVGPVCVRDKYLFNFLVIYIICVVEDERRQVIVHSTNEKRCTEFST